MAQAEAAETDAKDARKKLQIALNEVDTLRATIGELQGRIDDLTRRAEQAEKNEGAHLLYWYKVLAYWYKSTNTDT